MELVLNFDKKEMVVKEAANLKELYDRLEKLLGKELKNWTVVSDVVYRDNTWWYYQPYKTYPWYEWIQTPGTVTSGTYCVSDNGTSDNVTPEKLSDIFTTN